MKTRQCLIYRELRMALIWIPSGPVRWSPGWQETTRWGISRLTRNIIFSERPLFRVMRFTRILIETSTSQQSLKRSMTLRTTTNIKFSMITCSTTRKNSKKWTTRMIQIATLANSKPSMLINKKPQSNLLKTIQLILFQWFLPGKQSLKCMIKASWLW